MQRDEIHIPTREEILARKARLGVPVPIQRAVIPRAAEAMPENPKRMTPGQRQEAARAHAEKIKDKSTRRAVLADIDRREANRMAGCNIADADLRAAIERTLSAHGVTWGDVISPRRKYSIVYARQHVAWILRDVGHLSLTTIGRLIGGRDHTTVLFAIRKIETMVAKGAIADPSLRDMGDRHDA